MPTPISTNSLHANIHVELYLQATKAYMYRAYIILKPNNHLTWYVFLLLWRRDTLI